MAGVILAGAAGLLLLNQTTEATQVALNNGVQQSAQRQELSDLIDVFDNTSVDSYKIKRDWGSHTGPAIPYHYGPSLIADTSPTSVDNIRSLYIGGVNQTKVTFKNMVNTFDPYSIPPNSTTVVAMTPAGVGEDSFVVQRNLPIEVFQGTGRFPTSMYSYSD